MKLMRLLLEYIHYWYKSKGKHGIHSPFVFDLIIKVLNDRKDYSEYKPIEKQRELLLKDQTPITFTDHGAGSTVSTKRKTVSQIVKSSSKPAKYAKLLFRLVRYFKPKNILELGTSAGISAAYMASANSNAHLFTIEGSEEIASIAQKAFSNLKLSNIKLITGTFEEKLHPTLKDIGKIDMVYFDGNHKMKPTLDYFELCLPYKHNYSVFIFDDIRWSDEMREAWKKIKDHPEVTLSIDLFFMGLVFFRKEQNIKQHFLLRF